MTIALVCEGGVRGACSGLAGRPAVELPTVHAVAPTSYIRPILAPARTMGNSRARAPRDVDNWWRKCYNECGSKAVSRTVCGEDVDERIGQQSILCKQPFGLDEADHLIRHGNVNLTSARRALYNIVFDMIQLQENLR